LTHTTSYKAPALEKGLDILELLAGNDEGLNQKEISVALERKPSEIFRMIVVLEDRGYIKLIPGTERYQLTLKMFQLSNEQSRVKKLNELAVPVMNALARTLKQSCQISVYNSGAIVVVAQVDSSHKYNLSVKPGTRLDLLETASGMAILAFSSKQQQRGIASACGVELTEKNHAKLESIVKKGYAKRNSQVLKGVINIGAPVLNHLGEAVASLTVSYIDKGEKASDIKEVQKQTKNAALEVSRLIGYND